MKHYESELPAGYRVAKVADARKGPLAVWMNVVCLAVVAAVLGVAYCLIRPPLFAENPQTIPLLPFLLAICAYVVLHEWVHGLVYKWFTRQKLTFGLTLTVAYCGVPHIFVYRKAAMFALLAPFAVFTVVLGAAVFLIPGEWNKMLTAGLLGLHLGGCSGDLYGAWLYCFRFRSPDTLMKDTGPCQTFFVKE